MADNGVSGCSWIELPAGKANIRRGEEKVGGEGVQIEVDVLYEDLVCHQPEGEWQKIAPLRIMSYDIECAGRKGSFGFNLLFWFLSFYTVSASALEEEVFFCICVFCVISFNLLQAMTKFIKKISQFLLLFVFVIG